jgi:hypothetical protein
VTDKSYPGKINDIGDRRTSIPKVDPRPQDEEASEGEKERLLAPPVTLSPFYRKSQKKKLSFRFKKAWERKKEKKSLQLAVHYDIQLMISHQRLMIS